MIDLRDIERRARALARCECARLFTPGAFTDIDPRYLAVWVTTDTDAQRDALEHDASLRPSLVAALHDAGYPAEAIGSVRFAFESDETVQREWGGDSWAAIQ